VTARETTSAARESFRREQFLKAVNDGYAAVRNVAAAWAALEEERTGWDRSLLDGLPAETVKIRRR
jgi:hypothetical protein